MKDKPKRGELVLDQCPVTSRKEKASDVKLMYAQRFIVKHRGIYYCERDDGKPGLIEIHNSMKNKKFNYESEI